MGTSSAVASIGGETNEAELDDAGRCSEVADGADGNGNGMDANVASAEGVSASSVEANGLTACCACAS